MSRASGPAGASANAGSVAPPAVSADGRFVAFWSNATNLSPDDPDALYDLYRRDVASDETVLVSRASGKFGPKAAGTFDFGGPSISGADRLVAFMADAANLSPDDKDVPRTTHTGFALRPARGTGAMSRAARPADVAKAVRSLLGRRFTT